MKYVLSLLVLIGGCPSVFAQETVYDLPDPIMEKISAAVECLKSEQSDCNRFFDAAIALAQQSDTDTLLAMTYFEVCNMLDYHGDMKDRLAYAQKAIRSTNGQQHPTVTNRIYREMASAYRRLGQMDSIFPAFDKALEWAIYSKDSSFIAITLIQLAGNYQQVYQDRKAIELLREAEPYARASPDAHRLYGIKFQLATSYQGIGENDQAAALLLEAADGFLEVEDTMMYASSLVNWSNNLLDAKETTAVLDRLPKALAVFKGYANATLYAETQLGRAYLLAGNFPEALQVLKPNLKMAENLGNERQFIYIKRLLAETYLESGQPQQALTFAQSAYEATKEQAFSSTHLNVLQTYAKVLAANGLNEEAVKIFQLYNTTRDTVVNETKIKEIAALQAYYEAEQREAELTMQAQEITNLEQQAQLDRWQRWGLLTIIGLLLLGGWGIWNREQKRKAEAQARHAAELERENLEKELLQEQLAFRTRELQAQALHLSQKNELLREVQEKVTALSRRPEGVDIRQLNAKLRIEKQMDDNWDQFTKVFIENNPSFFQTLNERAEKLSKTDIRMAALLRMNLSSKEIASMLNISDEGVRKARYRLRKKLQLETAESLEQVIVGM